MAALAQRPKYGVEGLVYTLLTESSDVIGGTPAYGTVYTLPNVAKIGANPNGKIATDFLDDGPALVAETIGQIDVDLELGDIMPADEARLLGHTYANGVIGRAANDQSPWVAVGFKILRSGLDSGAQVYEYFWFYKGKFSKYDAQAATKKDTPAFQHVMLKGMFTCLQANKAWSSKIRTDDPNQIAATIANWFVAPVMPSSDTTAVTATFATGTGAAKTFTISLAKASANGAIPFSFPASSLAFLVAQLNLAKVAVGTLVAGITAVISSPGTGFSNSPIVITVTSPNSAAADACLASISSSNDIVDCNGTAISPVMGLVTLHA